MQVRPIGAPSRDGVIPVLGHRRTSKDARALAENGVYREPDQQPDKDLKGLKSLEDGELDKELYEVVGDVGQVKGNEEAAEFL